MKRIRGPSGPGSVRSDKPQSGRSSAKYEKHPRNGPQRVKTLKICPRECDNSILYSHRVVEYKPQSVRI
jgi:hypothetical protein